MEQAEKTFDPHTGLTTTIGFEDGKLVIAYEGDIAPALEYTNERRNDDSYSDHGIKANLWHCVHIPAAVCLKMKFEDGFDVYSANAKDVRKFLTRNRDKYSKLFVTKGQL